ESCAGRNGAAALIFSGQEACAQRAVRDGRYAFPPAERQNIVFDLASNQIVHRLNYLQWCKRVSVTELNSILQLLEGEIAATCDSRRPCTHDLCHLRTRL